MARASGRMVDEAHLDLPATPAAVGVARVFVRCQCEEWGADSVCDLAELLVSELVTNALLHARTSVQVEMRHDRGRLRVEVADGGAGRPQRREAALPELGAVAGPGESAGADVGRSDDRDARRGDARRGDARRGDACPREAPSDGAPSGEAPSGEAPPDGAPSGEADGRAREGVAAPSTGPLGAVPAAPDEGGRGLGIVDALSRRWGVSPAEREGPGKTVWFEVSTHSAAEGA